ncbi:hypothetical protein HMI54_009227 [Coelomomyces lativittatus]|nr:hypothetical protein HMI54_009227 [Coelomomyces lativittatus]
MEGNAKGAVAVEGKPEASVAMSEVQATEPNGKQTDKNKAIDKIPVVRGTPKSGRRWKVQQTKRASAVKSGKAFHRSWSDKVKAKEQEKLRKERERAFKAEVEAKRQKAKEQAIARRKQKEENAKKSSVVQVVCAMPPSQPDCNAYIGHSQDKEDGQKAATAHREAMKCWPLLE